MELEAALVDQRQESHARDVDRQHETGVSCGNLVAHEPIFDVSSDGLERDGKPAEDRGTALDPEARRILEALESHHWRREETAQALAISRTTLWRRMRELGIDE